MTSSDAFWLNVWETVGTIGFVLVIIGVIIEGVEHFKKFPKKEHARKLQIEKLGWYVVVIGLAMEFWGDHAAKRISERESARLNKEAGDARKDAGIANERASTNEMAVALLTSKNFVLREQILELEAKAKDRTITEVQSNLFILLTKDCPKIPVRVFVGLEDHETFHYAKRIRNLLDAAGFNAANKEGVVELGGIHLELTNPDKSSKSFDVFAFRYGTNGMSDSVQDIPDFFVGAAGKVFVNTNNPIASFALLNLALENIGLISGIGEDSRILNAGEFGILVPQKSH